MYSLFNLNLHLKCMFLLVDSTLGSEESEFQVQHSGVELISQRHIRQLNSSVRDQEELCPEITYVRGITELAWREIC